MIHTHSTDLVVYVVLADRRANDPHERVHEPLALPHLPARLRACGRDVAQDTAGVPEHRRPLDLGDGPAAACRLPAPARVGDDDGDDQHDQAQLQCARL